MKAFGQLYAALDGTTSTRRKVAAMVDFFRSAPADDAAWAVYFLAGGRPRRIVNTRELRAASQRATGLPEWLFDASYQAVGDLAETMALLLPAPSGDDSPATDKQGLAGWMTDRILPLRDQPAEQRQQAVIDWWAELTTAERFLLNKLLTGGFRVGVSRQLVSRAIAQAFDLPVTLVQQRLVGYADKSRQPLAADFTNLAAPPGSDSDASLANRPYPFMLAHSIGDDTAALGDVGRWRAEWKWDGIRVQLVHRAGQASVWSRGEDLLSESMPELCEVGRGLPEGTVLDGELLCWRAGDELPLPFAAVQTRLGTRRPGAKRLREAPVVMVAYDLLQADGADLRPQPLSERQARLTTLVKARNDPRLRVSAALPAADWSALAGHRDRAREQGAEGLMIKRLDAAYGVGRVREPKAGRG